MYIYICIYRERDSYRYTYVFVDLLIFNSAERAALHPARRAPPPGRSLTFLIHYTSL